MATTTTTPRPRAVKTAPAKAVPAANFASKSQRKQVRKSMARAAMSNWVAEKRSGAAERAEFYRTLRLKKTRRRAIAKMMTSLAVSVEALQQQIRRVEDRNPYVGSQKSADEKKFNALLDEAIDLARSASGAVYAGAAEWEVFAKRKIYFTEVAR